MFSRITTFFIIAVGYFVIASGEFHKCKIGDIKCLKEVGTELLVEAKGFSDINLISLDPMNFGDMRIQKDEKSPVNIDLKMKNAQAFGLAGTKIIKASGFGKDLKGPHSLTFHNDATSLVGDYDINGKVLILPIRGQGKSNITLVGPTYFMSFNGEEESRDGKTFMKPTNFVMKLKVKRLITDFENLFNDKALSDHMNHFLNENWFDIFEELKTSVINAMESPIKNVVTGVMEKVPYLELFEN